MYFDDLVDDGELFEAYDADIGRVDLVKTSANGAQFLLMKSGAGMLRADEVRAVLKSATPRRGVGRTFSYDEQSLKRHARKSRPLAKAATPQMGVYDAHGKLLGLCDPADVTPVVMPSSPSSQATDVLSRFPRSPE